MVLKDRAIALALCLLAALFAAFLAVLLRFEMVSTARNAVARLDHWNGNIVLCDHTGCIEPPVASAIKPSWRDKVVPVAPDSEEGPWQKFQQDGKE